MARAQKVEVPLGERIKQTYPILPFASTAGNGTQPPKTFRVGLYLSMSVPSMVGGAVSAKPTTAEWSMDSLPRASTLEWLVMAVGALRTDWAASPARARRIERVNIVNMSVRCIVEWIGSEF